VNAEIVIRTPTIADRERIGELDKLIEVDLEVDFSSFSESQFEFLLEHGSEHGLRWWVAQRGSEVVGFSSTHRRVVLSQDGDPASRSLVLSRIVVDVMNQRTGVGARLMEATVTDLKADGTAIIIAHIPDSAVGFYESQGWIVLEPGFGVGWIEPASVEMWEVAQRAIGPEAGPKHARSLLRTESIGSDEGDITRIAFRVFEDGGLHMFYPFQLTEGRTNFAALDTLARICDANPAVFVGLPVDVSRAVSDMALDRVLGKKRALEIRKMRR
jgi:ribosomal protein S18 acetylase RimI-like enzyme